MEEGQYIRAKRAEFNYDPDGINLFGIQRHGKSSKYAVPITWKDMGNNVAVIPIIRLEKHTAQRLIDDLWDCGLRPSEGTGSAGSLKKTENHLSDMRKIAFHKLGINNA